MPSALLVLATKQINMAIWVSWYWKDEKIELGLVDLFTNPITAMASIDPSPAGAFPLTSKIVLFI